MPEVTRGGSGFVGYEYMEVKADRTRVSMLLDCYACFGWLPDENYTDRPGPDKATLSLKRDRKILNKMELTRLQRNFEACLEDIDVLEVSKTKAATAAALAVGLAGTAFMMGSVFAVTSEPPIIWLCVLLAIPAFAGWALAPILHKRLLRRKTESVTPLIHQKQDEIYELCEKGSALLWK